MQNINLKIKSIKKLLTERLGNKSIKILNQLNAEDLRPLVYTSFDGDLLSHSELMKQFAFKKGLIPLNPEAALGTYLVVNHYGGKKYEIMTDCVKLLSLCDYFWIMTDFEILKTEQFALLPEGVIAEALYWAKHKDKKIGVVDINKYNDIKGFKILDIHLNFLHPLQKMGIKQILKISLQKTRKTVYLMAGEKHAKHSDWLRKDAYNNQKIPLCPYTLYNKSTLDLAYGQEKLDKLLARVSLAVKADEIWLFGADKDNELSLSNLELDLLEELYLTLKLSSKGTKIVYKHFGEAMIPKYLNRKAWSITEYEKINRS